FGAEEVWWVGAYYYLDQLSAEERDHIALMINADILLDGDTLIYAAGYGTDRSRPRANAKTERIDQIAAGLNTQYDLGFVAIPHGLRINADHGAFFYGGHTVLFLFGADYAAGRFNLGLFHSDRDDIHYIRENMPGRMERAMGAFSILLEAILLMD
ncbi:MAG: M28 family peptidase, partial [Oscillospiraceae bacterium]|nr:M28 family peptidase [Oscillospiraceae bacterium]